MYEIAEEGSLNWGGEGLWSFSVVFDIVLSAFIRKQKNSDPQKQSQHFVIWQISALFHYLRKGVAGGGGDLRDN